MNMHLYMMLMYVAFFFFFLFFFFKESLILNFSLFQINSMQVEITFWFDSLSLLFALMVIFISMSILVFSKFYMGSMLTNSFYYLLFMFVLSMLILIFSGNLFLMILGWDGLGIISFILVVYYKNKISLQSGLLTILMNRFGDVAMISFISLAIYESTFMMNLSYLNELMVFMLILGCITKSAQYPFSVWLPAAMTAPTPISSLVHSSTLVTAGIYLLIRFFDYLYFYNFLNILNLLGLLTMFMGGMMAILEMDLKKIVAFSTLSQLGMMMFILSVGEMEMCYFHLLVHAIFKSMLFMVCGCFMSLNFGSQDGRIFNSFMKSNYLLVLFLSISCFNLMGFFFMSGFYSKDVILESLINESMGTLKLILFLMSCIFTVSYTLKLYFEGLMMISKSFVIVENLDFKKLIFMFFMLYMIIVFFGLSLEEMIIMDLIYSMNQDLKFIDLMIILLSLIFWLITQKYNLFLNYYFMEFIYLNFMLKLMIQFYYKISIWLNYNMDLWVELIESDLFFISQDFKKHY